MKLSDVLRRLTNRQAWHGSATRSAPTANSKGAGKRAGVHTCGRAILTVQDCGSKWAQACHAWDEVRLDVRRISNEVLQAQAWHLAVQALHELREDIRQQFGPDWKEAHHDVDH